MSHIRLGTALACLAVATLHGAAQERGIAAPSTAAPLARVSRLRVLPGTRPDVFARIQGNALTSTNNSLSTASVRLRDARMGQIVESQVTDNSGSFVFRPVDPGSYVVELLGQKASVLAASQVLHVGAGEAVTAVVKLPFRIPFGGHLGDSMPSAGAVTSQAAASGLLATHALGTATCDNLQ